MKKCYLFLVSFVCLSLCFTACSNDDDDDDFPDFPESSLTPEEIKDLIQKEANEFLAEIKGLSSNKGVEVLKQFNELWGYDDYDYYYPYSEAQKNLQNIIQTKYADLYYTYTWDEEEEIWNDSPNSNQQLVFIFPSNSQSSENDAKIVVTGTPSGVMFINEEGEEEFELPKEAKAVVTVDGTEVAVINVNANWVAEKELPKTANGNVNLIEYTSAFNFTKGSPNKSTAVLKKAKTLIDAEADLDTDLDKAINDETLDKGKANVSVKILEDLIFAGDMDIKAYMDAEGSASAFNNNSNIVLSSRKEKAKLATLIAKISNGEMTLALKFDDKTEVDLEVYFGTGFESFIKEWNKFLNSFR